MALRATSPAANGSVGLDIVAGADQYTTNGGRSLPFDEAAIAAAVGSTQRVVSGIAFASPLGSGQDDGPDLTQAMAFAASAGQVLFLAPGTFTVATPVTIPDGSVVRASSATRIVGALTGSTSASSIFLAAVPKKLATTSLASPATIGSNQLTVVNSAATPVGTFVNLTGAAPVVPGWYQVESVAGNVLTLDRAVLWPYAGATTVDDYGSPPPCMLWDLGGAVISGSYVFGIGGVFWRSAFRNAYFRSATSANADACVVYNGGTYDSIVDAVTVDVFGAPPSMNALIAMVGVEQCIVTNSDAKNGGANCTGIKLYDSRNAAAVNCRASGNLVGLELSSDLGVAASKSVGCRVVGGYYSNNSSYGIVVDGSDDCSFVSVALQDNTLDGIVLQGGGSGNQIANCVAERNQRNGVNITTATKGTTISNLTSRNNGSKDLWIQDECEVNGYFCDSTSPGTGNNILIAAPAAAVVSVTGFSITARPASGGANFSVSVTGGTAYFVSGFIGLAVNGCQGINCRGASAKVNVQGVTIAAVSGAAATVGLYADAGALTAQQFNASGTATPLSPSGGSVVVNMTGTGSPAATVNASAGSVYQNTSGGAGTTLWVNESGGVGGWVGK